MALSRGDAVRLELTKWGDHPHWQMEAVYLGQDEAGDWIGFPRGTRMARPGMEVISPNNQVGLVPAAGTAVGQGWVATFHGTGGTFWTYVDMTTVPVWDGHTVRAVDLDLDVIERLDRTVFLDDEDEFDDHRVALGYPDEVVELALATSELVLSAVSARTPPFDGRSAPWLEVLRGLTEGDSRTL